MLSVLIVPEELVMSLYTCWLVCGDVRVPGLKRHVTSALVLEIRVEHASLVL
jgi:hypothetical protein